MAHHCTFIDRVEIEEDWETNTKHLVRIVEANWSGRKYAFDESRSMDVYKEIETGTYYGEDRFFSRNLYYTQMSGYLVAFPGEQYNYYGYRGTAPEEDWGNSSKCNVWCNNIIDTKSEENIIELYPNFKYVLRKMPDTDKYIDRIMDLLEVWKQHPEIEGLCQLGFYQIATNKSLFKLTLAKRKQIIKWIMENKDLVDYPKYFKLSYIQKMIKWKMTVSEFKDYDMNYPHVKEYNRKTMKYEKWVCDVPTFRYLKKHGFKYQCDDVSSLYYDYLKMAKKVGHDIEDAYWKYPSDIGKAHDKVMQEMANIQSTASALQGDYLKAVMQPLAEKFNSKVDGYDIFLPTDIDVVKKQCDVLYQCLLRNNYINNVLMQDEILVFIWKDGNPVATAEVFYDKKLGQFYGDERGHREGKDCRPSEEVQKAFEKWFSTFEPYKVKAERQKTKKHWYKGFHSVDKDGIYHTSFGDYSFEVGKTYATPFEDQEILARGGEECVATNRVFHFCESIEEISRHYMPTCYAEVEPLGPVVECDGAFLSNRIKIVKALSEKDVAMLRGEII